MMRKEGKNIDDFFKEELGNYTETPPPAAWDALEKKLATAPPGGSRNIYRRLGYFALLLLIVSLSVSDAHKISRNSTPPSRDEKTIALAQEAAPVNTITKEMPVTPVTPVTPV